MKGAVIALVGRPNVGKSTLFNRLCGGREALVHDQPGLTRDRQYGRAQLDETTLTLIDTGGLFDDSHVAELMASQVDMAVEEADLVVLLVDARSGLTAGDETIAHELRKRGIELVVAVNKVDGTQLEAAVAEFSSLGFDDVMPISAAHGRGIGELRRRLAASAVDIENADVSVGIPIAIVGRPNVGKSTLVNAFVGEQRQVVFDEPGTTRDAITVPLHRQGTDYALIDTAGVRRKGKVADAVEKFSVVKTLEALDRANVALLLIDAREGIVDQDLHVISYAEQAGTGMILVVNKWDGLSADHKANAKRELGRRMQFAPWIPIRFTSALHGTGVGELFADIDRVNAAGEFDVQTSQLTQTLERAVQDHPPPSVNGRQIKLRYAHKNGSHPPAIMLHGNQTESLPASYLRYLENRFRDAFDLVGLPIKIACRTGDNPYSGEKNALTKRQWRRRQRLIRHRKKRR